MDNGAGLASQEEVTKVVRAIVSESDLDKITQKDVRLAVNNQLGPRLGDNVKRTKTLVKRALDIVLGDVLGDPAPVAESAKDEPSAKAEPVSESVEAEPSGKVKPVVKAAKVAPVAKVEAVALEAKSESKGRGDNATGENAASDAELDPPPRPVKRARKRIVYNEDQEDDEDDGGDEEGDAATAVKNVDSAAPVPKPKVNLKDDSDEDYANGGGGNSDVESSGEAEKPKRKRKRGARGNAEKPAQMTPQERQLKRYLTIARQIGRPVPPSQLRNKSTSEKRQAVIAFLKEKGFDVLDSSNLNKRTIEQFRRKVDQEKELAELDTSNIIEGDDGRPRRRRSATRNPVSYTDQRFVIDDADSEEEPTPEESPKEEESEGYVGSGGSDDDE